MPSTTFKSYRRRLLAILVGLGLWAFAGWAFIAGGTQQLAAGADLTARDRHGDTALHTAVNWQRIEALRLLIAHGAPEDGPLRHTLEYGASVEATAYSPDGAILACGAKLRHAEGQRITLWDTSTWCLIGPAKYPSKSIEVYVRCRREI